MAIKNSISLKTKSNVNLPAESVITVRTTVPPAVPVYDDEGVYQGIERWIIYSLSVYQAEADITTQGIEPVLGGLELIPSSWQKEMTEQEYNDLRANGALAEIWLKDQIEIWTPGNNPVLIDPYPPAP